MKKLLTVATLAFLALPMQAGNEDQIMLPEAEVMTVQTNPVLEQTVQKADDSKQVKVELKSGTTIKGILKSFDPLSKIILIVAGQETTIYMRNVANVEMVEDVPTPAPEPKEIYVPDPSPATNVSLGNNKLIVTETAKYPAKINMKIGATSIEMVLVKGGRMNMGYNGSGSLRMRSEPIHEVVVTSFYMSTRPLPASLVKEIVGSKNVDGYGESPAEVRTYDDVEKVIASVARQTGRNLRLPTEAEWEYAACGEMQNTIFSIAGGKKVAYEWCSDFSDKFPESEIVQVDPTGPTNGKEHVIRAYNGKRGKFDRSNKIDEDDAYLGLVRLVIKAKDIK